MKDDFFEILKEVQGSKKIEARYEEFSPSITHKEKHNYEPPGKVATDLVLQHLENSQSNVTEAFREPIKQMGDMVIPEALFIKTIKVPVSKLLLLYV